jgi:ribosome-binding ATPase YchF (GTP1/OBG family)
MKFAVLGLADFQTGKKNIIDERLNTLEGIIKPSKTTFVAVEVLDAQGLKDAEAVICEKESKLELIINDLEIIENRLMRTADELEIKLLSRAKEALEKNLCLSEENFTEEEKKILLNSNLASIKPVYFTDKNENKPAQQILFDAYYAAGMICFITGAKDKELRAWSIRKGITALDAAGAIHSDIKRGFIKAEVIGYDDLIKAGSLIAAKHAMHLEGKEYIVKDAEILNFRFNV